MSEPEEEPKAMTQVPDEKPLEVVDEKPPEFTEDELAEIRAGTREQKQRVAANLLFNGCTYAQVAGILGMGRTAVWDWFRDDEQKMRSAMKSAMAEKAIKRLPKYLNRLEELTESENQETRRKAVLDLMRAAGIPLDPGAAASPASINVSVSGGNAQFNFGLGELDRRIGELAKSLGPEAEKLVEAEGVDVRDKAGKPPTD